MDTSCGRFVHHVFCRCTSNGCGLFLILFRVSLSGRSTTSPGETSSSLTRRPSAAERRKMCFVRKQTNSAPNSMDEDVPSPSSSVSAASTTSSFLSGGTGSRTTSVGSSAATAAPAPERPGYFNFDSMQRLLDLSMSVNVPGERKSFYLEIPSQEGES